MEGSNYYLYKSGFMNAHPANQINYEDWMKLANEFKSKVTDEVLEEGLKQFPREIYAIRHDQQLQQLKQRRMAYRLLWISYYHFSNQIVDIHTSNKNEFILAEDVLGENATVVTIRKINKSGELEDTLMHKKYPRSITREIRFYIGKGDDSLVVNNINSGVRLRVIGGKGDKAYNIINSSKRIKLYDREEEHYYGQCFQAR